MSHAHDHAEAARLVDALVAAAGAARWPSGALLVDLDEQVIRAHLAPPLVEAWGERRAADATLAASRP
jgi:hypothetical protein